MGARTGGVILPLRQPRRLQADCCAFQGLGRDWDGSGVSSGGDARALGDEVAAVNAPNAYRTIRFNMVNFTLIKMKEESGA